MCFCIIAYMEKHCKPSCPSLNHPSVRMSTLDNHVSSRHNGVFIFYVLTFIFMFWSLHIFYNSAGQPYFFWKALFDKLAYLVGVRTK